MKEYTDKESRILDTAAEMFATQPFHKVLLSDVARVASVGKGTLYLYFKSKDDLYFAVLFREFAVLIDRMRAAIAANDNSPEEQLLEVIRILSEHLIRKAAHVALLGSVMACPPTDEWQNKRKELWTLIEEIIQRGVAEGIFEDNSPRLTAQYITGLIRSSCLFKPDEVDADTICAHASGFVLRGLGMHDR